MKTLSSLQKQRDSLIKKLRDVNRQIRQAQFAEATTPCEGWIVAGGIVYHVARRVVGSAYSYITHDGKRVSCNYLVRVFPTADEAIEDYIKVRTREMRAALRRASVDCLRDMTPATRKLFTS